MVAEAANEAAHSAPFHPVLDWLRTLRHDGTERVDHWLADHLGVVDTPYTRKVARYFLVGMCARVLRPGCKFDYCLVLEGTQGKGKSTALRILGGEWFSDTELDLAHKDSMSYIRGKWLHEFGELGSLARSEELRQKSFLSRQVDEFRPTYGRREIRCPGKWHSAAAPINGSGTKIRPAAGDSGRWSAETLTPQRWLRRASSCSPRHLCSRSRVSVSGPMLMSSASYSTQSS